MNQKLTLLLGFFILNSFATETIGQTNNNTTTNISPYMASNNNRQLATASWHQLPDWDKDNALQAYPAFLASCSGLKNYPNEVKFWLDACTAAKKLKIIGKKDKVKHRQIRHFFQNNFSPYRIIRKDEAGEDTDLGLITGYFEPLLYGSLKPDLINRYPLLTIPRDFVHPANGVRGRLVNKKIIAPYYSRAEIETQLKNTIRQAINHSGLSATQAATDTQTTTNQTIKATNPAFPTNIDLGNHRAICWVSDPVDLFFLHIQGSGRIKLTDGSMLRVSYANQNGHPYRFIGQRTLQQGKTKVEVVSRNHIKEWGRQNPDKLQLLLNENPSFVFFKHTNIPLKEGPPGALGVSLTAERSIAVDPLSIPLGAPVFLETVAPDSSARKAKYIRRLMMAQDTGGAIKGGIRADFFWGFGDQAGNLAEQTRFPGRMWLLLPKIWSESNCAATLLSSPEQSQASEMPLSKPLAKSASLNKSSNTTENKVKITNKNRYNPINFNNSISLNNSLSLNNSITLNNTISTQTEADTAQQYIPSPVNTTWRSTLCP